MRLPTERFGTLIGTIIAPPPMLFPILGVLTWDETAASHRRNPDT
jgi:hypothetical protein